MHIRFLIVVANIVEIASIIIPMAFLTMMILGITLTAFIASFSSVHAQADAKTKNQTGKTATSTPSKQASQSIRGAITDTGQFLHNVTEKASGSKSAQTIVNESSDVLGNATVATKKYFCSK